MADPLLSYSLSTTPLPLQVSTAGAITIVASNPGGHSDQPAQDYVAVSAIVFDFGASGSGGSELTTAAGTGFQVTPPAGWGTPAVAGLRFTFTPPAGGAKVFPSAGLAFAFAGIPVNATVGTVVLQIAETASSPGNPAEPDLYPPLPLKERDGSRQIGKFPANFTLGPLLAMPPDVPAGGSTTLSWSDSPGATYELDFRSSRITQHANQAALQSNDTYPNPAAGDAPLALQLTTVFTLTASYVPPGGSTPATFQRQITVGVNSPDPVIDSFSVTPAFVQVAAADRAKVGLSWCVKNGREPDCVAFGITPSLPAFPGRGSKDAPISGTQVITLTAYGAEGTTPATQSHPVLVARGVNISAGVGPFVNRGVISPDGTRAFFLQGEDRFVVIDASGPDITKWRAAGSTAVLPSKPFPFYPAFAQSDQGQFLLCPLPQSSQLGVFSLSPAPPAQWPLTLLNPGTFVVAVAATPDGKHVLVVNRGFDDDGPSSVVVLSINGSDPAQWPATPLLKFPLPAEFPARVSVSPRGDYAFLTVVRQDETEPDKIWVISLSDPNPAKWHVVARITQGLGALTSPVAVSPDGRTGLVANGVPGGITVLDLSSADPGQWQVSANIGDPDASVSAVAFSARGDYAFASSFNPDGPNPIVIVEVSAAPPAEWPIHQVDLPGLIFDVSYGVCTSAQGAIALVGSIGGPVAGLGSVTVVSLDPKQP